jgi:hypothetical protein
LLRSFDDLRLEMKDCGHAQSYHRNTLGGKGSPPLLAHVAEGNVEVRPRLRLLEGD